MPSTSTSPTKRASCAQSLSPTTGVASPRPDGPALPQTSLLPSSAERTIRVSLYRLSIQFRREQGLGGEPLLRVTHQYPANRHRRHPRVIPNARPRDDIQWALTFTIPGGDSQLLPSSLWGSGHLLQSRQTLSFLARSPHLSFPSLRRRFIERGIEPQAGDDGHLLTHRVKQIKSGKTAVGDDYHFALGQPALDQKQHLAGALGQLLMGASALFVVTLRGTQRSQEGQRPDTASPGNLHQEHQGEPAQTARLDEMGMRGAHRVAGCYLWLQCGRRAVFQ